MARPRSNVRRSRVQSMLTGDLAAEYAMRLHDPDHWTLDAIRLWLAERGIRTAIATIHRDRRAALTQLEVIAAKAKLAQYFGEEAARSGVSTSEMNAEIAGQMIFDLLQKVPVENLQPDSVDQVIRLMEATVKARGVEARAKMVDLQRQQLAKSVAAAKAAIDAAAAKRSDGAVTREAIFAELDKIMKGGV